MRQKLIQSLRDLSCGTIASLTNFRDYELIEKLRATLIAQTEQWIEQGVLDADAPWQTAWNLFKSVHDFHVATKHTIEPDMKLIHTVSCGCCDAGCVCSIHMDIPRGIKPTTCRWHVRVSHPKITTIQQVWLEEEEG